MTYAEAEPPIGVRSGMSEGATESNRGGHEAAVGGLTAAQGEGSGPRQGRGGKVRDRLIVTDVCISFSPSDTHTFLVVPGPSDELPVPVYD